LQEGLAEHIAFANVNGEAITIDARKGKDKIVLRIKDKSTGQNRQNYKIDSQCQRTELLGGTPYDPRLRPWYKTAVKAREHTWADIFLSATGSQLEFSSVLPVYSDANQLVGVLNSELNLQELSEFISKLQIGHSGQALIIDRGGQIVASTSDLPTINLSGGNKRSNITNSSNPLIRATTKEIIKQFGSLSNIDRHYTLDFNYEGNRIFAQVKPLDSDRSLDWLAIAIVPESDLFFAIPKN
jgi:two-component system sensor histidine kinase ChiS